MGVVAIDPGFPFGNQFAGKKTATDGLGSFTNEDKANAAETKPYESETVEFIASGVDSQGALITTATGMPPGIGFVDEGAGKLHLIGTPSNSIIPTLPTSIYEGGSVSTGGTPSSFSLGDQDNIYKEFSVTVKSKHIATGNITLPLYVIKDWNVEKETLLNQVNRLYPE
jgi:hypothetical protein